MQEHFSKLEENEKTNYSVEVFSSVFHRNLPVHLTWFQ